MQQSKKIINGVPVDRLAETIAAVEANPSLGESRFRAHNRWVRGSHNRSVIQSFYTAGQEDTTRKEPFVLNNDEPPQLHGDNDAPNPVEFVLHGLAGCVTTTFLYYAAAQGIEIDELESTLEGDIDLRGLLGVAPVRPGYQQIRMSFRVKSKAPRDKLDQLIRLAQSRSPVFSTVSSPVDIKVSLKHES